MPKKFHFRAPATAFDALAAAGIDVVTMANNHAVDYGEVGLRGHPGRAAERRRSRWSASARTRPTPTPRPYLEVRRHPGGGARRDPGLRLDARHLAGARPAGAGVATASDPTRLAAAVRAARRTADVVVVYLHWGTDYTTCPNALQKRTAKALADAGADVVVGAHAHRLQGAGWLGDTLRLLRAGQLRLVAAQLGRRRDDRRAHPRRRGPPGRLGRLGADARQRGRHPARARPGHLDADAARLGGRACLHRPRVTTGGLNRGHAARRTPSVGPGRGPAGPCRRASGSPSRTTSPVRPAAGLPVCNYPSVIA